MIPKPATKESQIQKFKRAATEHQCDQTEAPFLKTLGKLARQTPSQPARNKAPAKKRARQ